MQNFKSTSATIRTRIEVLDDNNNPILVSYSEHDYDTVEHVLMEINPASTKELTLTCAHSGWTHTISIHSLMNRVIKCRLTAMFSDIHAVPLFGEDATTETIYTFDHIGYAMINASRLTREL